jgi:nitrogen fixation protein FixH
MMGIHARPFTGRHVTAILLGSFAVVLGVNLLMANLASSTFGGVVVENSYVASQEFNRWLDEAERARALGWRVEPARLADGRVEVRLSGVPGDATVSGIARHPVGRQPDQPMDFVRSAQGRFVSTQPLPAGRWTLRLDVAAAGHDWRAEAPLL